MPDSAHWLSTAEVAEILNVSESGVRRWCRKNKIEHRRFGSLYRIPRRAVEVPDDATDDAPAAV